jgi:hypothetical protein
MGAVLALAINLESVDCGECGGSYALNERYINQARAKGGTWHCPYCQTGWGYAEGTEAKLKKQLAAKEQELQAERERKAAALTRANLAEEARLKLERAVKKHKTRTAAGTCPCCTRTFKQLAAHMKNKHPDYAKDEK